MSDSCDTEALLTVARVWKQTKILLVDHWVNTMWFRLNRMLLHFQKERDPAIFDNKDDTVE
jgi:hypothetical protein